MFTYRSRSARSNNGAGVVIEILAEDPAVSGNDETSYETVDGTPKNDVVGEMSAKIVEAIVNDEVPAEIEIAPIVTTSKATVPPVVPECMADAESNIENFEDPNYVPGDGCSLAAQLGVEPENLGDVIDTDVLPTYDENQQDEIEALEEEEEETVYKPPVEWSQQMWPSGETQKNTLLSPPPRFELLDAAGDQVNTALYEATVTIETASNGNQQFGEGSVTTVVFDENNQAIFENIHFDFPGTVTLRFSLTQPDNTGLPDYIGDELTISGGSVLCENATCAEQACEFGADRIVCVDNNLGSSTTMLLETLQEMNSTQLGDIKWLVINQNKGLDADELVGIMALLVNLERLSLNSDDLWYLHPDTFNVQTKLQSISLHNNAINCLDGVFDHLITHNILKRVRLTENDLLMDSNGWNAEYRYRGDAQMADLLALVNGNLCTSRK